MIVPMKHLLILSVAAEKLHTIEIIRELGVMHLSYQASETTEFRQARREYDVIQSAQYILKNLHKPLMPTASAAYMAPFIFNDISKSIAQPLPTVRGDMHTKIRAVIELDNRRRKICDQLFKLRKECAAYRPYGEFDITLPEKLTASGVPVQMFRYSIHSQVTPDEKLTIKNFGVHDDFIYGVLFGVGTLPEGCEILPPPPAPLSEMQLQCAEARARIAYISEKLVIAAERIDLQPEIKRMYDLCCFIAAHDSMSTNGQVVWISGWMPAECEKQVLAAAHEHAWGILMRDPREHELEQVPTLLRPPRGFKAMHSLFSVLGINPAYNESDVSVPFFAFFSIFFAMLVGDGGYGTLILLITLFAARKMKKAPRSPFILLGVFSIATIIWGALSNTWFGCHPQISANPISAWFSEPGKGDGNMMLLCFTLGVVHLSVARLWNAISLFPNTKFLAEVGWIGVIWFMYFTAGSVVGVLPAPGIVMQSVLGLSIVLILGFMLKLKELKTEGSALGMLPLNVISCLGDIISYVRLFAVGLASVRVAENFNEMAIGLDMPFALKLPCMIIILLLGHGLNLAMAGLGILVHAVRLNTLEFSNHKGITWSGFAFTPLKHSVEEN